MLKPEIRFSSAQLQVNFVGGGGFDATYSLLFRPNAFYNLGIHDVPYLRYFAVNGYWDDASFGGRNWTFNFNASLSVSTGAAIIWKNQSSAISWAGTVATETPMKILLNSSNNVQMFEPGEVYLPQVDDIVSPIQVEFEAKGNADTANGDFFLFCATIGYSTDRDHNSPKPI